MCRENEISNRFTATRAIVYPARNPDEITASFDWVIYDKAASIMKMMEEALGKENYDQAINKLLIRVLAKIKKVCLTVTRPICLPPHTPVAQKISYKSSDSKHDLDIKTH